MNIEDCESRKKSREIVKTILDYGVSQNDILNIIKSLSLELEDIEKIKKINNILFNKEETLEDNKVKFEV